jgi:hypothetical protein
MSLRHNYVRITHTEDTKSFSHSICRDFNYFHVNDKESNTWKRDVLTVDFEQLQISVQISSFLFHSSQKVYRLTQMSWRFM